MSVLARIVNLLRGAASGWIGRRERRNPSAVYEAAIEERAVRYAKLREAAAGVLYMRSKLAGELARTGAELARTKRELEIAVDRGDDEIALVLIARRDRAKREADRLGAELRELEAEAEAAKKNLIAFQDEIARLREEKVRMLARLANAKARLRLQETLAGLSPDADVRALEAVREHVHRLVEEARLTRDLGDAGLEKRLGEIRAAEAESAARAELDELKKARRSRLLPVLVREHAPLAS
jgi:phage shock protein A